MKTKYLENPRKLTRKSFKEWLKSLPQRKIVGCSACVSECPIATFLGTKYAVVRSTFYCLDWKKEINLPKWAQSFIERVDEVAYKDITAKYALQVLETLRN